MAATSEDIINALRFVNDPDIKKDLVTLNMISEVEVINNNVRFKLTLTTPACPLKEKIRKDCVDAIHERVDKDLQIEIQFDSNVTTLRKENVNVLPSVKNIICVASG
ncbi:MAG: iron-sulfur cluster assembly protein, partial [Bacteroidetes bacterium]|nr:iron-sulfur cluster assembly protein [Bacteroidota bacterium]